MAEAVAAFTAGSSKEHVYRLVAFPKATEEELGDQIPVHVQLAVTGSTHVLAVARVAPDVVLWGVVPAKEHVPCAGASTPPQSALVSRAYWKLEEALVRHGIDCKGARALDIGAAPGGAFIAVHWGPASLLLSHTKYIHDRLVAMLGANGRCTRRCSGSSRFIAPALTHGGTPSIEAARCNASPRPTRRGSL